MAISDCLEEDRLAIERKKLKELRRIADSLDEIKQAVSERPKARA